MPTPFGFFDSDAQFQGEADSMVTFVKRKLGDDVLSVELTRKQIWSCFEEACCEYSRLVHELKIKSELVNVLGLPTGSTDLTNKYPRQTLEYLLRLSEPYATEAYMGGSYDATLGYFDLEIGRQDYNIYTELNDSSTGTNLYDAIPSGSRGKIRIVDVFHFEPTAAQGTLLNASNITNFLASSFNYESYVNSTVFYVLPVFEDVLRRGMLETAHRVRRSNYSYEIIGSNLRIFPIPQGQSNRLYVKVFAQQHDPTKPSMYGTTVSGSFVSGDDSIYGVSGPSNVPLDNIPFTSITQPGRQWIRQYTLALAKELLGLIRSKFSSVPIPNSDLQLNGAELVTQGREDKEKLQSQLREFLENFTTQKMMEQQAQTAAAIQQQLKFIPMPSGRSIIIG